MKINFKYIIAALALVAATASCSRKIDFPADKFVTLDHYAYSVDETAQEVVIPVHIYHQDNNDVQVAVKLVADSAVEGTDYEIISPESGVLSFTDGNDSLAIKIAIKPHVGTYTGTKKFGVQVTSTTEGVMHGEASTATVTIKDLDHPLASILGDYIATGLVYSVGGQAQWKVTLSANEESVSKINVTNLSWLDETVVGTVSDNLDVITIPFGQTYMASGYVTLFCGYGSGYYAPTGNLILTKTETGWIQSTDLDDAETSWGIFCMATDGAGNVLGYLDYILPGITLTK